MKTLQQFPYQNVLVLGLAKSGDAAAQLLHDSNVPFKINDLKRIEENDIARKFQQLGVEVVTGKHPIDLLDGVDLVVKNPGIPYYNEIVSEAVKRNIPIITEVELSFYLFDGPIIAITGSNGKTTTTTLIYELLKEANLNPLIAGNIGQVATNVARSQKKGQPVVIELSSFQLKAIEKFKPDVAVLLNITEAHLDFHKTMDDYLHSKLNITLNQTNKDLFIYSKDYELIQSAANQSKAQKLAFSVEEYVPNGISLKDDRIYYQGEFIIDRSDVTLPGQHNLENVLAAIGVCKHFNISNDQIKKVLQTFTGVKHRLQYVKNFNGRKIYNDSKATNVAATLKAIHAFKEPIVLIAGGLDRGNEFDELISHFDNVKSCVVFGQSSEKIVNAAKRQQFFNVKKVNNLIEATIEAYKISANGDVILFSPACASWDQFASFEERGDMFVDVVHKL
ncbi:UDP-N-acetylmuramoyl-L-alanine--D-glutamate ligase [Bacillaceae bacterium W0354]